MDIVLIYKRVIGLDVHQAQITGCAITEQPDGSVTYERREFGGFKRDRKALAEWARLIGPDIVVMESTGIYWKSPYAALESVGIVAWVVNARHVKAVPGRKTDVADALVAGIVGACRSLARLLHCQSGPAQPAPHCPTPAKTRRHASQRDRGGCTNCSPMPGFVGVWWCLICTASRHAPWSRRSSLARPCPKF